MNILVDARPLCDPSPGGVTRVAAGLLPALIAAMPQDRFVLATTGLHRPTLTKAPAEHLRIPNKLWSILCFLGFVSFDRVFGTNPDLLLLPNIGFVGNPEHPYALVVHDVSFLIEPRWFSFKARMWHHAVRAKQLIKNATYLFAVSATTKNDLMRLLRIPAERITVIPLATSEPEQARSNVFLPPTLEGKRYVVALGGNDPRKNTGCAERAVAALKKNPSFSDVTLIIVGRDLNRPSDEALATLMKHASALLYPSWYEGYGLPLHEAAHFGTPCIASTAGALPETAPTGTIFVPPGKPHLWTEALEQVLSEPGAYRTESKNAAWDAAARLISSVIARSESSSDVAISPSNQK